MTIAEFVKERRKKLGMTQVTLADRAGVGLRFVRDLEPGKETLRLDKVNQVLQMFGDVLPRLHGEVVEGPEGSSALRRSAAQGR